MKPDTSIRIIFNKMIVDATSIFKDLDVVSCRTSRQNPTSVIGLLSETDVENKSSNKTYTAINVPHSPMKIE